MNMPNFDIEPAEHEEVETEVETDELDNSHEEESEDYVAPSKEEWAKVQAALNKANEQAKKYRFDAKAAKDEAAKKAASNQTEEEQRVAEAAKSVENKYRPILVKTAAKAAFKEAGLKGDASRVMKFIDMDELEIDDDGSVSGLDEQVAALKEEYPEFFIRSRYGDADAGRAPEAKKKQATATEIQAAGLLGKNR